MSPRSSPEGTAGRVEEGIVNFHQSETCLPESSRQTKLCKFRNGELSCITVEFSVVLEQFVINRLKSFQQKKALEKLVSGEDMFVTQSASSGMLLIFQSVPIAFDALKPQKNCQYLNVINPHAPVVQRVDNAIHRINRYPVDSAVCFVDTYPLDSDLSGG